VEYTSQYAPRDEAWTGKAGRPWNPGLVIYAHADGSFSVWDPARPVRWPERLVDLRVTRDVIKHSPTWTPGHPITKKYEDNLLDYYGRRQALSMDPRSNEAPLEPHPPRT
jgi:hypothetical protein